MKKGGEAPELTYIHTGLLAGLLLGTGRVGLVVGGCGTGIGFLNAALQMPGVTCGLIQNPLDAFLFSQINDGNCISLASTTATAGRRSGNVSLIFDSILRPTKRRRLSAHRQQSQAQSRQLLGRRVESDAIAIWRALIGRASGPTL